MSDLSCVEVALRIRPLVEKEIQQGCKNILEVYESLNQVKIKTSSFTYNYVFDCNTNQDQFYNMCIKNLLPNLFKGYNITVLAYGQTGSGKTHSMGTNYSGEGEMGVIPRAMEDIFNHINIDESHKYDVTVSFIELYQEILYDLLANKPRDECSLDIREDLKGIQIPGLTHEPVTSQIEALSQLIKGSQKRAVGSTNMNKQSSRSHAIFTINIVIRDQSSNQKTAKFHLVDLAGSERSKKTGATGVTFKEGVNINKGLLALGNVISALGCEKTSHGFICYRDSNLTRLLKDSLGGNSLTLMIACVSPADYNLEETISTLRYANRARNIRNKPIINEDIKAAEINKLNEIINELRLELAGKGSSTTYNNTKFTELEEKYNNLMLTVSSMLSEKTLLHEKMLSLTTSIENGTHILSEILEKTDKNKESGDSLNVYNEFRDDLQKLDKCLKCNTNDLQSYETMFNVKDIMSESIIREKQEIYATNQMALNAKLENITKMISNKEQLAKQLTNNAEHIVDHKAMAENEEKIKQLEMEREGLLQQLKNPKYNKQTANKKNEIQELERRIEDLKKKVAEQARLLKVKAKDQDKIGTLNREILSLKQTKVKLIKNMKEELDKFRKWKIEKERELSKLKDQDRKRQNAIIKMEKLHIRQQNVLRRKVEEATAINKRLKDALALRKNAREQKVNSTQKINQWLQEELELFINIIDARSSLEVLMEDRAILQEELDLMKNYKNASQEELNQLQSDIETRSVQISDFQQKLLDSEEDTKSRKRWDNIQTMSDAKQALTILFDKISDIRKKGCLSEMKTNELTGVLSEHKKKNDDLLRQLEEQEAFFKAELNNIERANEEKVTILLRELRNVNIENGVIDEASNKFSVQLDVINNLQAVTNEQKECIEQLYSKVKTLTDENNALEAKIERINNVAVTGKYYTRGNTISKIDGSDSEDQMEDNKLLDPDWRKTPLARRLRKIKDGIGEQQTIKRNYNDSCACKKSCNTKSCKCRKLKIICTSSCKCMTNVCTNRDDDYKENGESEPSDDSYKKRKTDSETETSQDFSIKRERLFKL